MITKCFALLAVVAQISASCYNDELSSVVGPTVGSSLLPSPTVFGSSDNFGFGNSGVMTRNLIGQGKYPVALGNCGPNADIKFPITTSSYTAPVQEKPTIRLPANIPPPRVISHTCTCYKTFLRPRVHQQIITVPSVQRYLETSHKPVVENIQYEALPFNCGSDSGVQLYGSGSDCALNRGSDSGIQFYGSGSGCPVNRISDSGVQFFGSDASSGSLQFLSLASRSPVQSVEIPSVQIPQIQQFQDIKTPQVQVPFPSFTSCQC